MTINQTRYVDITSGVNASATVTQRELVGRLFSINSLIPPQTFLTFTSADAVSSYFGSTSEEYARAAFYFGWVSKNFTSAQSIQFARWAQAAVAPYIFGAIQVQAVAHWTTITGGAFAIVINGATYQVTGLNFSTATTLNDIASTIQTALRLVADAQLTTCTVVWNSTRGSFDFNGTLAVATTLAIQEPTSGTSIVSLLGWGTGAIVGNGSALETVTDVLTTSANMSDNFGSFLFMPALSVGQIQEAALWNQTQNVKYLYTVPVSTANVATYYDAVQSIGGTALTLSNIAGQYPEMDPMIIEAATDYTRANVTQNYMYQQFSGLSASVQSDKDADIMDESRINYYGRTQSAGQLIDFYQTGVMMGLPSSPLDMNTYVNEIWLKSAASAALLNLLLASTEISANQKGRGQILAILQSVINLALNNGTISVGKTLTASQKVTIGQLSNDDNAWYQVQTIGYWVDCVIVPIVINGVNRYQAEYTLLYSKDDVIRKIIGTNVLN